MISTYDKWSYSVLYDISEVILTSSCFFFKPVNPALRDEKFFNQLEDDVSKIVQRDKRREQYSNSAGHEVNTSSEQEQVR